MDIGRQLAIEPDLALQVIVQDNLKEILEKHRLLMITCYQAHKGRLTDVKTFLRGLVSLIVLHIFSGKAAVCLEVAGNHAFAEVLHLLDLRHLAILHCFPDQASLEH